MLDEIYNLIEDLVSQYRLEDIDENIRNNLSSFKTARERLFFKMSSQKNLASLILYKIILDLKYKKISTAEVVNNLIKNLNLTREAAEEISAKLIKNDYVLKELSIDDETDALDTTPKMKITPKGIGQELV
ncbi:MAG: hypothetical protein WC534_01810 [Candidatus Paceibacterota bacterium]